MLRRLKYLIGFLLIVVVIGFLVLHLFWSKDYPDPVVEFTDADFKRIPPLGMALSAEGEFGYEADLEGQVPKSLHGVLYRNGPGLYDRGKMRKRCLIDGDGMIQMFRIENGRVFYQNRFVRTKKYLDEEKAGRFIYPTFTTQAPGGFLKNLGGVSLANQAGVTVVFRNDRLYAFDEYQNPYELNPQTLETVGLSYLGLEPGFTVVSAHNKIDPKNSEWVFFGIKPGRKSQLYLTILDADDRLKWHRKYVLSRYNYTHDFFMTPNYLVFSFHPAFTNLLYFLTGRNSVAGSLTWQPEKQNVILVFKRESSEDPKIMQTEAFWMWHTINAFEADGKIIADFIGYDKPDHFIGNDPRLFAVMQARSGDYLGKGRVKRMVIDPAAGLVENQKTIADGMYGFPHINRLYTGLNYRYAYAIKMVADTHLFDGITRIDIETGDEDMFSFGAGVYTSEPVFAPKDAQRTIGQSASDQGWLLVQIYDSHRRKSGLAVFDASRIDEGPLAIGWLQHRMPMGFHGTWQPG